MPAAQCNKNIPAKGIPYFTPAQVPPAGTAFDPQPSGAHIPKLFQPLKIRGVEFQNRIWVSPMCQYSAKDGIPTPWHMAHLGGIITRGPGLTMMEATAVVPEGRITPEDCGIWSDHHIKPLAELVTFAHSQSQKIGIQLAHGGRKASTVAPWISGAPTASKEVGGWPDEVYGPSAIPYAPDYPPTKELSKEGIKRVVNAFVQGAKRAVEAGFDVIEIHSAHGYLLDEFLSPAVNKRTDEYGGTFENRTRLLLEIVVIVRANIPKDMPLFVRVSATDWLEESLPNESSWRSEDTVRLAPILHKHGVDLLDVSTGGNHSKQKIQGGPAYQSVFARDVMQSLGARTAFPNNVSDGEDQAPGRIFVSTVGAIEHGQVAEALLQNGCADVVFVGRQFLRNPGTVWAWADELSVGNKIVEVELAAQIRWGFKGRGHRTSDGKEDLSKPHVDNKELHVGSCKV